MQVKIDYENLKADSLVKTVGARKEQLSFQEFIKKNLGLIVIILIVGILAMILTKKTWMFALRKKLLRNHNKELDVNRKMVDDLQRKYYIKRTISRETYDESFELLSGNIMELDDKISLLNKKIKKDKK